MKITKDTRSNQWTAIVDLLTLKQLSQCMGDDFRTWETKAVQVKRVSRSKRVHAMADSLIATCRELQSTTTYFQGLALPRTELVKTLIKAHVCAVQEYDHESAEDIEDYLFDLGHFRDMIDSITPDMIAKVQAAVALVQS